MEIGLRKIVDGDFPIFILSIYYFIYHRPTLINICINIIGTYYIILVKYI